MTKMISEVQIDVQDIDHLGIIAEIVDEIGIVESIDQEIGTDVREKVSAGQVVKAMMSNCMGFLTAPLYLFSEFFAGIATEHLIGEVHLLFVDGIKSSIKLTNRQQLILQFLGSSCHQYYFLS